MKHILLCIIIFHNIIIAQEDKETSNFNLSDNISIAGEGSSFINTFAEYRIDDSWIFRAERNAKRVSGLGTGYSVFEFPMLAKYQITNKFSALLGPKTNLHYKDGNYDHMSTFGTFGLEYEVTPSVIIEGRLNLPLSNQSNTNGFQAPVGFEPIYKLGTRFKF